MQSLPVILSEAKDHSQTVELSNMSIRGVILRSVEAEQSSFQYNEE
jgi:hypothetical protein